MTLLSDTLKQYWGYDSFKGMQKEAITSVLER
ncbi:ATP-dependent DNA helicase RecQ [Acinetobacter phage vB_AbaM_ME3]|uniref:ATP-dependent DNA helicase RecQ n=1 Tax=Acinetobacter phage vB_AbaM_ME3 TaxID=1837876 RepID=A0A172Q075_9CAUD|nr:ATP-dependent DNA helicase RecQ [Acinetobacter phage vB_AbaM_ME3]AND75244.1 ATP-dependent DNA helicase RecQ [Acinetobacter phage vB_AbaM_ME3]